MHSNQDVILRGHVRGRCIGTLKFLCVKLPVFKASYSIQNRTEKNHDITPILCPRTSIEDSDETTNE